MSTNLAWVYLKEYGLNKTLDIFLINLNREFHSPNHQWSTAVTRAGALLCIACAGTDLNSSLVKILI